MREWSAGTLTIAQQAFAETAAARFTVVSGRSEMLSTGLKLEDLTKLYPWVTDFFAS